MRRFLFARSAPLAVLSAFALSACQPPSEPPVDPAPTVTAEAPVFATAPVPAQTPAPTPPPTEPVVAPAADQPCRDQIGEAASAALVQRCIQVSPATHPPCNAANPCEMIQGEIDRSCALWERDGNPPDACKAA